MKRKKHEDHVNHEAWAIPYADLMTLLLAFFVVMYAVSVVNEGKYRVMSESIIEAFNGNNKQIQPVHSNNATPVAPVPAKRSSSTTPPSIAPRLAPPLATRSLQPQMTSGSLVSRETGQENLQRIQDQVEKALQPLIDKSLVVVRRTQSWLEIEIRTDILFPSGVARLSEPADVTLRNIAGILAPFPNPLRVEGYTDDMPINTAVFPSNWELSAARAATVARLFSEHGVDPNRLGIIGWGEYKPAADNVSQEGRNRNRRVLVVVLSDQNVPARFSSDAQHAGQLAESAPAPAPASTPQNEVPVAPSLPPGTLPVSAKLEPLRTTPVADAPHGAG
ncbi:chemotaxis protein MotB [Dyella sp. OK004]|uniref:flagellar motor protein MotD n=1 Tax=Dyella sp. OK004 TaxID=1855292 RepID=UPI0008F33D16|nr:flagellar motor protein MotD [Dyella sp. OK004]SFR86074.1 chemotaxis protein MotB [Dyella sp. OK004]